MPSSADIPETKRKAKYCSCFDFLKRAFLRAKPQTGLPLSYKPEFKL